MSRVDRAGGAGARDGHSLGRGVARRDRATDGLSSRLIEPILERLVQLNYVSRTGTRYQGIAWPSGP